MPFTIRKKKNRNCYMVVKKKTRNSKRKVFSKCTSREKAVKQVRLLQSILTKKKK